jgi:hypothetical protein
MSSTILCYPRRQFSKSSSSFQTPFHLPYVTDACFTIYDLQLPQTSALQRVGLTEFLDLHWIPGDDKEKGKLGGTPTVTFFAPTNQAFKSLPKKLQWFLFSPFGSRALKKLLQFHIVPGLVAHSGTHYMLPVIKG